MKNTTIKTKIAATIRLIISTLFLVGGFVLLSWGLFRKADMTLAHRLADILASCGLVFFMGIWFYGLFKWCGFAIPKTFHAAKSIAREIIPLSFFALIAEVIICMGLTLIPFTIYGMTLTPVAFAARFFMRYPENVIVPLIVFIVFLLGLLKLMQIDFKKIVNKA